MWESIGCDYLGEDVFWALMNMHGVHGDGSYIRSKQAALGRRGWGPFTVDPGKTPKKREGKTEALIYNTYVTGSLLCFLSCWAALQVTGRNRVHPPSHVGSISFVRINHSFLLPSFMVHIHT